MNDTNGNLLTVTTPKLDANTAVSVTQFGYNLLGLFQHLHDEGWISLFRLAVHVRVYNIADHIEPVFLPRLFQHFEKDVTRLDASQKRLSPIATCGDEAIVAVALVSPQWVTLRLQHGGA